MKQKLLLARLIILIISLYSCEDKTQTTQVQHKSDNDISLTSNNCYNDLTLNQLIDTSGPIHNMILDYQFGILQAYKDSTLVLPNNLTWKAFTYNSSNEYFTNNCSNLEIIFSQNNEVEFDFNIKNYADTADISLSAKTILIAVDSLLNLNTQNNGIIIANLNSLITQSKSLTDTTEKLVCGITTSVAKSSYIYWSDKHDEWDDLFSSNSITENKINKLNGSNRKHAYADAAGALYAGSKGVQIGFAGGVGGVQGAVVVGLMGAVVGACVSSAQSIQSDKAGWEWIGVINFW